MNCLFLEFLHNWPFMIVVMQLSEESLSIRFPTGIPVGIPIGIPIEWRELVYRISYRNSCRNYTLSVFFQAAGNSALAWEWYNIY